MKLIVGLGNPGRQYEHTPHNAGFAVVDEVARSLECSLRRSLWFNARVGKTAHKAEPLVLLEPLTYMNRSGSAVSSVLRWHKLGVEDLVVVLDDADIGIGRLRIRAKGSSGGHKGLASIIESLGTEDFVRIRLGIGRDSAGKKELVDYVLAPFSADEKEKMGEMVKKAASAVMCVVESGVAAAMNGFNN
ncbi:MAG: aminoacyl-tRNA hydrolase [Verrucomicrobia bacterium]|nr:aminoacyl-tRNA hydrolase [Verrucomicrobiota bacterium]